MKSLKVYSATKFAKTRAEVEKEIQDRWNAVSKAKAAEKPTSTIPAQENMPLRHSGGLQDVLSSKSDMDSASASRTPSSGSDGSSGGFLDKWLSQKDD